MGDGMLVHYIEKNRYIYTLNIQKLKQLRYEMRCLAALCHPNTSLGKQESTRTTTLTRGSVYYWLLLLYLLLPTVPASHYYYDYTYIYISWLLLVAGYS